MKVFLDDKRECPEGWTLVRTYDEAIKLIEMSLALIEEFSFDHDLGLLSSTPDRLLTGKDVADFLIDWDLDHGGLREDFKFQVHSANPTGAENIRSILQGYLDFKARNK